ncbi:hypothetical protein BH23THE1_BH23THE1_34020 [soil metagenome]
MPESVARMAHTRRKIQRHYNCLLISICLLLTSLFLPIHKIIDFPDDCENIKTTCHMNLSTRRIDVYNFKIFRGYCETIDVYSDLYPEVIYNINPSGQKSNYTCYHKGPKLLKDREIDIPATSCYNLGEFLSICISVFWSLWCIYSMIMIHINEK